MSLSNQQDRTQEENKVQSTENEQSPPLLRQFEEREIQSEEVQDKSSDLMQENICQQVSAINKDSEDREVATSNRNNTNNRLQLPDEFEKQEQLEVCSHEGIQTDIVERIAKEIKDAKKRASLLYKEFVDICASSEDFKQLKESSEIFESNTAEYSGWDRKHNELNQVQTPENANHYLGAEGTINKQTSTMDMYMETELEKEIERIIKALIEISSHSDSRIGIICCDKKETIQCIANRLSQVGFGEICKTDQECLEKTYQCYLCRDAVLYEESKMEHMINHFRVHKTKNCPCIKEAQTLAIHLSQEGVNMRSTYKPKLSPEETVEYCDTTRLCDGCKRLLCYLDILLVEVLQVLEEGNKCNYICNVCTNVIPDKDKAYEHVINHAKTSCFFCSRCLEKKFGIFVRRSQYGIEDRSSNLVRIFNINLPDTLCCVRCTASIERPDVLMRESSLQKKADDTKTNLFLCLFCDAIHEVRSYADRHTLNHFEEGDVFCLSCTFYRRKFLISALHEE